MYPSFTIFNIASGMFVAGLAMMGIWYTNTWNTAYLPINSNKAYDHFGQLYQVTKVINSSTGHYDHDKFVQYSFPYLSSGLLVSYFSFFAVYAAVVTHVAFYHRYEIALGFRNLWRSLRRGLRRGRNRDREKGIPEGEVDADELTDVHARLMKSYREGKLILLGTIPQPVRFR